MRSTFYAQDHAAGSPPDEARHARKAVIAATIGTMIEWYDFYIYGLVAALVFGKLFFPQQHLCLPKTSFVLACGQGWRHIDEE